METADLLTSRFKVVADYPNSPFKVGEILERVQKSTEKWYSSSKTNFCRIIKEGVIINYPHLFRKIEWYECRKKEEMPTYLKQYNGKGEYFYSKVIEWETNVKAKTLEDPQYGACLDCWSPKYGYYPATEKEYLNSKKNKQK